MKYQGNHYGSRESFASAHKCLGYESFRVESYCLLWIVSEYANHQVSNPQDGAVGDTMEFSVC
jgi:hypothetical protein